MKGKHRFAYCQVLYQEIHDFVQHREWAPAQLDNETAGTTWLELFVLFDIAGNRTGEGQHVRDPAAKKRAEERWQRTKKNKSSGKRKGVAGTCVAKPTLDQEIKLFKSIMRQVMRHEASTRHAKWFQAEGRARLRRLARLG